ncbi:MAG: hypothetical protein ABIQ55_13620 [Gemmatimonadaceae bacterium]
MSTTRFVAISLVGFILVAAACATDDQQKTSTPAVDSVSLSATAGTPPRNTGWDAPAAGTFVLLSVADDRVEAELVLPEETDSSLTKTITTDATAFANASVDLFNTGGLAGTSTLTVNQQQQPAEGCLAWPSVRLTSKPAKDWRIGLTAGKATAILIHPIEELGSSDSSSSAIELARLASEATAANRNPAFQGLPFAVRKAYQLSIGDTAVLFGSVVRKINEEANPREEHLLLVAERIGKTGKYLLSFQNRSAGPEDAIRTNAVLAAVRFVRTKQAAIILSFEYDDGGQIALLERVAPHDWKIKWRSAYTGC